MPCLLQRVFVVVLRTRPACFLSALSASSLWFLVNGHRRIQKRARDAQTKEVRRRLLADVFGVEDVARRQSMPRETKRH